MNSDLPAIVLTLIISGTILFAGTAVVSSTIDAGTASSEPTLTRDTVVLDGPGTYQISETIGKNHTVYNSRGYAVNLTGAPDSYIQSEQDIDANLANHTWTVSVWAARNQNTTETKGILSVDGNLEIAYDGTQGEYIAWYYDAGSAESVRVSVDAPTQPKNLTNIVVVRNQSTLTIYSNTTQGQQATLDGVGSADSLNSNNWDGRLDEVRVVEEAWNSTLRQQNYQNPVDPIATDRRGRVMFDEPSRATQRLFYSPGDIQTSNATFSQGLPGEEMVPASVLLEQSDYEWLRTGPRIDIYAAGELATAPAAYVDYDAYPQGASVQLLDQYQSALQLAGLALVLLPLGAILASLFGVRSGR